MIPILYEANEATFTSNGLGRLRDCISCTVTESRNDAFECVFEYPVDGAHFQDIQPGRIIAVRHDDTEDVQPFDIVSFSRPIDGVVSFYATHIGYRTTGLTTYGQNINSLADALTMLGNAQPASPFTYTADFTSAAFMASADGTPRSVRQFIGGIEGSILDTYGGELEWDRFNVILHEARGQARDFSIRYGVNMTNYQEETDYQGTFTSCIPYWTGSDANGDPTVKVGGKVDSGAASYNGRDICVPLDLTDKFETIPTTAQLETEAASQMAANQSHLPAQTIDVDFIRLQDMPEYQNLGNLLQCQICDTITVVFPYYNTAGQYKIVKTTYDVLEERFTEMQLGSLAPTLSEALGITTALEKASGGGGSFTPTIVALSGSKSDFTSGTTLKTLSVDETLAAGKWLIFASVRYTSSSTGYRSIQIRKDGSAVNVSLMQTPAGGTGNVDLFTAATVTASAAWVLDLNGRQNSGSSMTVDWYIHAVKIAEP